MAKSYNDKLKDPRWQKKRLVVMQRDNFACKSCYDHESTLHVHHVKYLKSYDPWDYPDDYMITLCDECHAEWHRLFDNNIKPGKTFLVAKLNHDLDIEGMQNFRDGRMD